MPANLTPQYYEAEKRLREAKEIPEKIAALEEMLTVMPKHKGTDHLRADLTRKIAKLKIEATKKKGTKRVFGYKIDREGAGQVVLAGAPNTGKSELVCQLTKATPEVAPYAFTTRVPTPGMMAYENTAVQLIDMPPLSNEYTEPWLPDMIRRADLVAVVVDLSADPLAQLEETEEILRGWKMGLLEDRQDLPGWRNKNAVIIANKLDAPGAEETLEIFRELMPQRFASRVIAVSTHDSEGLDRVRFGLFDALGVLRVYTKAPGKDADKNSPFILPRGTTLEELAERIHKDFRERLKYAKVWGVQTFQGQMVQKDYVLAEGDIVEFKIGGRAEE